MDKNRKAGNVEFLRRCFHRSIHKGVRQSLVPGPFQGRGYSSLWSQVISGDTTVSGSRSFPESGTLASDPRFILGEVITSGQDRGTPSHYRGMYSPTTQEQDRCTT